MQDTLVVLPSFGLGLINTPSGMVYQALPEYPQGTWPIEAKFYS